MPSQITGLDRIRLALHQADAPCLPCRTRDVLMKMNQFVLRQTHLLGEIEIERRIHTAAVPIEEEPEESEAGAEV